MKIDNKSGIIYNTNMKIVIDTNIIIAGMMSSKGYSHQLIKDMDKNLFTPCLSVPLLYEYEEKLKEHLCPEPFTHDEIDEFLDYVCSVSEETKIFYLWRPHLKDPFDDHVLEVALASSSNYIVTFNKKDFKNIEQYGVQVVNPGEFYNIIERR